ncbi:hypothetical protein O7542_19965 [Micromonospora sp. WMMC264]|uniref:hypothetical protein n=1 Tax=Micromonospora sp. WMMC264 TaxID=3015158 RepID=UPI002377F061|nr:MULTISPECIES: hypothetical protein [Micromonospora]WBB83626.1 hypothetical protein O7542_19965 [Micromonospora sp. WMMC264]WDP99515.1 hypothetical protein PVK74_27300 [Micromonospora chalcea]
MAVQVDPEWWSSGLWNGRPILELLRQRDITTVFRFLHARGMSYGRIAALVGLSPHRATEIAKGVRQVTAYEVLERIAVGLNIPRPVMGLGRNEDSTMPRDVSIETVAGGADRSPARMGSSEAGGLVRLRLGLDEALAASSVAPRQLELIEQSAGSSIAEANQPTASSSRTARVRGWSCRGGAGDPDGLVGVRKQDVAAMFMETALVVRGLVAAVATVAGSVAYRGLRQDGLELGVQGRLLGLDRDQ